VADVRSQQDDQGTRLNVLFTCDRHPGASHWARVVPRLLEPQGVRAVFAKSGFEAVAVAQQMVIHAAVIDLSIPRGRIEDLPTDVHGRRPSMSGAGPGSSAPAGFWLLEFFRRLPNQPGVVAVQHRAVTQREVQTLLRESLRLGAFSVLPDPVNVEQLLEVLRRYLDRQYRGLWPLAPNQPTNMGGASEP
jgi:CheY-like chemotaxis protein